MRYILNKRTKTLHQDGCGFVPLILTDNYQRVEENKIDELIRKGHIEKACVHCFGGY